MYTYTPKQNIQVAKARISNDANTALSAYLKMAQAEDSVGDTRLAQPSSNASVGQSIAETAGDIGINVLTGLGKFFEGIADFGASTFGVLGADQEKMSEFVSRDLISEWYHHWERDYGADLDFENSYINKMSDTGQKIVRGVSQGVGQMIPMVALTFITGGAAAGAAAKGMATTAKAINTATKVANLASLGMSATGNATEQALNDVVYDENGNRKKVDLDRAYLYGLASGAVEVGTETLVGGGYEAMFGEGVVNKLVAKLGKSQAFSKATKFALNAVGEGVEEVAAEAVSNTLQTIYNSSDGKPHWEDPNVQDMFESGVVGAMTAAVVGGAYKGATRLSNTATINESIQTLEENEQRIRNIQDVGKYDAQKGEEYNAVREKELGVIENRLGKMSQESREKIFKANPTLSDYFNSDGTRIQEEAIQLNEGVKAIENTEVALEQGTMDVRIKDANKVANVFDAVKQSTNETLSIAQNLDETQRSNLKTVKTLTNKFESRRGTPLKLVVFESDAKTSNINAFISGDVMYIEKSKLNSKVDISKAWVHEGLGHFTELSKAHTTLVELAKSMDEDLYNKITNEVNNDSRYSEAEKQNEIDARILEEVIGGNEDIINRLVEEDASFAKKLVNKIKDMVTKIKATITGDQETLNYLKTLEILEDSINYALSQSGVKHRLGVVDVTNNDIGKAVIAYCEKNNIDIKNAEERANINEIAFSTAHNPTIVQDQTEVNEKYKNVKKSTLEKAIADQNEMAELLKIHPELLPLDEGDLSILKTHKVLKGNSSYGLSVENTTICVRTLAYIRFVDSVQEKLGRPMTASESFLASQMLYKIAKEPQCMYCYVSLDRKAYNEFLKRYIDEKNCGRDAVVNAYKQMSEEERKIARDVPTDENFAKTRKQFTQNEHINPLYAQFIKGKKNTANMQERYSGWLKLVDNGDKILSLEDVSTQERMNKILEGDDKSLIAQLEDAKAYAQAASWAKKQEDYVAYFDEIRNNKKLSDEHVKELNREFGLRFYSFSDFSPAFILENMQEITDASIRGLKGLAYTKALDFVKIFAETGMNINVSLFVRQNTNGEYYIDGRQSAVGEGNLKHSDLQELLDLREKYKNVGIVCVATDDAGVEWALDQEWSDVVIPFHIVRTGADIALNYQWKNYKNAQGEKKINSQAFESWIMNHDNKSVEIFPTEHHNDKQTYLDLCKEKGVRPKFKTIPELFNNPNYMKLVNETRLSVDDSTALQPIYNIEEAKKSFNQFIKNGGYFDGYFMDGVNYGESVDAVVEDVQAIEKGEKGYKDIDYKYETRSHEDLMDQYADRKNKPKAHKQDIQFSLKPETSRERAIQEQENKRNKLLNGKNGIRERGEWFAKDSLKKRPSKSTLQDSGMIQAMSILSKIGNSNGTKAIRGYVKQYIDMAYNEKNDLLKEYIDVGLLDQMTEVADNIFRKDLEGNYLFGKNGKQLLNNSDLTVEELTVVKKMLMNAQHIVERFDKLQVNDQFKELDAETEKSITTIETFSKMLHHDKVSITTRNFLMNSVEPAVALKWLFGMQDNVLSDIFEDVRQGETRGKGLTLNMALMLDEFSKNHKKYRKTLGNKVTFLGKEITKGELLTIVKYWEQEDSKKALLYSGFGMYDEKTHLWKEYGRFVDRATIELTEEEQKLSKKRQQELLQEKSLKAAEGIEKEMYSLLTDEDKEYLKVIADVMKVGSQAQIETDLKYKGYSDINEDSSKQYMPIRRYSGDFAKDSAQAWLDGTMVETVGNQSINKARIKNMRRLNILPIDVLTIGYATQVGNYYGLALPIKEFQRALNFNVNKNINRPISIRNMLMEKVGTDGFDYINKLLNDIQGIRPQKSTASKILSKIRSGYVVASLGLNLKVTMTQFASYLTAGCDLKMSSLVKGLARVKVDFKEMDKYSEYAKIRNSYDDVVKAEGADNTDNAIAKAMMFSIGKMDRLTIGYIWNACQYEIESNHSGDSKYKFGTEANKKEAAVLFERECRRTQPNYSQSERTGFQRSTSEIAVSLLGVFKSVPSKMLSRLVESSMELRSISFKKKNGIAISEAEKKRIHTKFVKTIASVTASNILYVMIAQLVKFIFDKDRKDKNGEEIAIWQDALLDFGSITTGLLPLFGDLYSTFIQGYDFSAGTFATSALSDVINTTSEIGDLVANAAKGKDVDWIPKLRKLAFSISSMLGIPARNVYNELYGILKRFDPSTAYKMNNIFYNNNSYKQDLEKAIKNNDNNLANTIIGVMMDEKGLLNTSDAATQKIKALYEKGYTQVLPKSVNDTISYEGTEYELSAKQQSQIKTIYNQANTDVDKLLKSSGFDKLTDEVQCKAIKWIYDYYYENAVAQTLGLTVDSKKLLFGEVMSVSRFALAVSTCGSLKPDYDKDGKAINGTKKAKVIRTLRNVRMTAGEREMVLAYLGYSVDETIIKRYIARLGFSKGQQKAFLSYITIANNS